MNTCPVRFTFHFGKSCKSTCHHGVKQQKHCGAFQCGQQARCFRLGLVTQVQGRHYSIKHTLELILKWPIRGFVKVIDLFWLVKICTHLFSLSGAVVLSYINTQLRAVCPPL